MGFSADPTPAPSPLLDDVWATGTGLALAGNAMTATRGFVGAAGLSRMTSGVTAAEVGATLSRTINGVGAVGIGVSVIQANQALAAGDTPTAALSGLDAVAGVAAFIPGPDIAAAAYGLTRIVGDIALGHTKPRSVMADLETLSKAGCL